LDTLKRFLCAWKHNQAKLSGAVRAAESGLAPVEGARWEGADIESIFSELERIGIIRKSAVQSYLKCPECGNIAFHVLPVCPNCGAQLTHIVPKGLIQGTGEQVSTDDELFKSLKLVGAKTVKAGEEISFVDTGQWQCPKCGSPVTSIKYVDRCTKCGHEIRDDESAAYYDERIYSIENEKASYYAGYVDDIISLFNEFGFTTDCLGTIVGKSGIEHTFDLVIRKHDITLTLTIEMGSDSFSMNQAVEYYTKAYDTFSSATHMLIVIPTLGEEEKGLFAKQSIDYIEADDPQAAVAELRKRLELLNEKLKASTGIPGFDRITEGGLLDRKVYLVLAESGLGKSTLGLQFLIYGAKNGIPGILITTTQQPQEVMELANSLGFDLKKYIDDGKLAIMDLTHQFDEVKAKVGDDIWKYKSYVAKLVNDISKQVRKIKAGRLVIDTVTPLMVTNTYDHAKELVDAISQLNCLTLLTKEATRQDVYEANFVPGVIELRQEMRDGKPERLLLISKLRNSAYDASPHRYTIKRGEGLIIS
jgi:KaiC/GvpD/RAD55 family RecA-like ATPase/Zn finger protein HypA/HybF involved in hydrogenase expression